MTQNNSAEPKSQHKLRLWKAHIEHWQQSGLSQAAYCRQQELKLHQFTYWKKRSTQPDTGISFVPLHFSQNLPVAVKPSTFKLLTPNGFKIEVGTGFDPTTLKQLLAVVVVL